MAVVRLAAKLAVLALIIALAVQVIEPSEPNFEFNTELYDLEVAVAPRVAGHALKAFGYLIRLPIIGHALLSFLLYENKFYKLRQFSAKFPETPTYYPISIPTQRTLAYHLSLSGKSTWPDATSVSPGEFHAWTSKDFVAAYLTKSMTPTLVAERILAAISDSNARHALNAIVHANHSDFLAQAAASTARYAANAPIGPLDGVPIAIKEEMDVIGYRTTIGTLLYDHGPSHADAMAVARLRSTGALILGGANMHELGIGTTGINVHFGTARNPYNTAHHTGGSSSGSAASVAAGITPLSIGADGGGSIRLPAALCGVFGLKPTFARVPSVAKMAWSVGHTGPFATSAGDLALAYSIIAGADVGDQNSLHQPIAHTATFDLIDDLSDLTVGVYWDWAEQSSPDVLAAFKSTLQQLQHRGAKIHSIRIPFLDVFSKALATTITAEMATFVEPWRSTTVWDMGWDTQIILSLARQFSAVNLLAAQEARTHAIKECSRIFASVDVILTPGTPITAPEIPLDALAAGESNVTRVTTLMRYMFLANLAGIPGVAIPVGYDTAGLPISVQAMGPHWSEHVLLRLAHAIETMFERKAAQVFYDVLQGTEHQG
eukprot:m.91683 g.91683  ORF g.91683 m.91683 type:complete len:604 (+) comp8495_c0_seq2:2-1813(+)